MNELDREIVLKLIVTNNLFAHVVVRTNYLGNGLYQNELIENDITTYKSNIDLSFHDALALGTSLLMG